MKPTTALLLMVFFTGDGGPAPAGGKAPPRFQIDHAARRVVRLDGGTIRWSTSVPGDLAGGKDPHLLWDLKRVYVRHNDGITALAAQTGVVLWHAKGPTDRLVLSGELLLTTRDGWVTARAVSTGGEVFKERLPQGALAALFLGEDRVLLTGTEVVRLPRGGKARWATPLLQSDWLGDGGLVEVAGGDLVAFSYCPISDSGVQLARLNGATGEVVWRAGCAPLGVKHSKYKHDAAVAVEAARLRVTSDGSYGTFVEILDLKTGKKLKRIVSKN
jgi:outer membrane protein assembly factor BamB